MFDAFFPQNVSVFPEVPQDNIPVLFGSVGKASNDLVNDIVHCQALEQSF
jgi:hypothetical protein